MLDERIKAYEVAWFNGFSQPKRQIIVLLVAGVAASCNRPMILDFHFTVSPLALVLDSKLFIHNILDFRYIYLPH